MNFEKKRKPVVVVVSEECSDLTYRDFDTLEEARAYADSIEWKALIIGPDSIEDYT